MARIDYTFPKHKIISDNEMCALLRNWHANHCINSRDRLLRHNLRFIARVAYKLQHQFSNVPLADLIGYGIEGYLVAMEPGRFDANFHVGFNTYAVNWVRQNITRSVEDLWSIIRQSANHHEDIKKKIRSKTQLSDEDIVILDNAHGAVRTHDMVSSDDNNQMTIAEKYSFINHNVDDEIHNTLYVDMRNQEILKVVAEMPEPDRSITLGFYGLAGTESMSLREISEKLCLKNETVRQIKDEATQALRGKVLKRKIIEVV